MTGMPLEWQIRVYAALSRANQAIMRSDSIAETLDGVCSALVELGGFCLAWAGCCEAETAAVIPCAGQCSDPRFPLGTQFFANPRLRDRSPDAAVAVREDRPVISHDAAAARFPFGKDTDFECARLCATGVFPIRIDGQIWGVLAVGVDEAGHFGEQETVLLEDAADSISFALRRLHSEAERRHAEEKLRETQQRLALTVEGARLGLWEWNLHTGKTHFSREYKHQLGYDDRDFSQTFRNWEDQLHPDDREWTLAAVDEFVKRRGDYQEIEFRLRHQDGSYRWMLSRAVLQPGPDGAPERMIGCHIDITDRKLAEEGLRRSEANLSLAERIAHVGYWERPRGGSQILWSDEAYRVFGLAPQEQTVDLDFFLAMVHPDDREAVREAIRATMEEDSPYNIEYRIVRPDGTIRFVHSQGELFLDALGRPDRMFGTMLDITDRKRVEQALRDSQGQAALLADILQKSSQPFGMGQPDGHVVMFNEAARHLLGCSTEDLRTMDWLMDFTPPEWREAEQRTLMEMERTGAPARYEKECVRRDGSRVPVEMFTHLVRDEKGAPKYYCAFITDITERKRAEDALRKSEQWFRATFEDGLFGMGLLSPDGRFLNVNPAFCQMLGYSEAELRQRTFVDITHPDDRAASVVAVQNLLSGETDTFDLEKRYQDKAGRTVWGIVKARLLRNPDGTSRIIVAQVQDITERKRAEQEILENQRRLKRAQAVGRIGSWEYDPNTRKIWGTEEAAQILGVPFTGGEFPVEVVEACIPEWSRVHPTMLSQLEAHRAYDVELAMNPLDGSPQRILRAVAELLLDAQGQPFRIVGVAEDITEQKRTAEALRETQERLRLALESSGVGTWDWDVTEGKLRCDGNARHLFGFDAASGAQTTEQFMAAVHPDDRRRVRQGVARATRLGSTLDADMRMVWPDESVHDISVQGKVYRDTGGKTVRMTGICRDITAHKEAEMVQKAYSEKLGQMVEERTKQLRDAQDELVRKEKLAVLGQLAGGVGHELRNPLGVISNAVYYLKLVHEGGDETSKEYLNIISNEVYNAQKIISDLLGFARTSRAERSAVILPVLVAEVIEQIAPRPEVEVRLDIPEDLPMLSADLGQMRQVLSNLMVNACQAMPGGGLLTVAARCSDGLIRVSVTDTGCGMSDEELPRVFEPLYTTKARGIGLGLSVTRNLVEANGGGIVVKSEPGKGSTFMVLLPAQEKV